MHKIEYLPLRELNPDPSNPKDHDVNTIDDSFMRFGVVDPIVIDGRTGYIVSGHGRRKALLDLASQNDSPPEGIRVDEKGEWLVPTVVGWSSANDLEAKAALIALNRTTELGGWVDGELLDLLEGLAEDGSLVGVGYSTDDIEKLRVDLMQFDDDELPEYVDEGRPTITCPECGHEF